MIIPLYLETPQSSMSIRSSHDLSYHIVCVVVHPQASFSSINECNFYADWYFNLNNRHYYSSSFWVSESLNFKNAYYIGLLLNKYCRQGGFNTDLVYYFWGLLSTNKVVGINNSLSNSLAIWESSHFSSSSSVFL